MNVDIVKRNRAQIEGKSWMNNFTIIMVIFNLILLVIRVCAPQIASICQARFEKAGYAKADTNQQKKSILNDDDTNDTSNIDNGLDFSVKYGK